MPHHGPGVTNTTQQLPVFALPEFTLFKGTLVPFHIFEPRYCEMIERSLADRRLLVVSGLQPGWESYDDDDEATAPVYETGGLGRVVSDRRFPDGRWNIFVHCIERVRITDRMAAHPGWTHPVVDVTIVADRFEADGGARLAIAAQRMQQLAGSLARELGPDGAALSKVLGSTSDPSVLSNRLASLIVRHPDQRQILLEEQSPLRRCTQLADVFASELMEVDEPTTASDWVN